MICFHIPAMTRGGCAQSVTEALLGVAPQARIETDPPAREVQVDSASNKRAFRAALSEHRVPEQELRRTDKEDLI